MTQHPFAITPHQKRSSFFWLVAMLFVLAACFGSPESKPRYGDQVQLSGQAFLVCTQECADRGQCGMVAERGQMVLLSNIEQPMTRNHPLALPHRTAVTIQQVVPQTLVYRQNPEQQLTVDFYVVVANEQPIGGWVAGWCVTDRIDN